MKEYVINLDKSIDRIVINFETSSPTPPTPPEPSGEYTAKVKIAQPINQWDGRADYSVKFGIEKNQTKYFLIDPKGFGINWKSELLYVQVRDVNQSKYIDIYYPILYKLNSNNDLITKYTLAGSGDFGKIISGYKKTEYEDGVKFLLEIIEKGKGSQSYGLTAMWHFN